jgi:hypothetical protein
MMRSGVQPSVLCSLWHGTSCAVERAGCVRLCKRCWQCTWSCLGRVFMAAWLERRIAGALVRLLDMPVGWLRPS